MGTNNSTGTRSSTGCAVSALQLFASTLALVASFTALYFAWQANQIAKEANELQRMQVGARVEVLSVKPQPVTFYTSGSSNSTIYTCDHRAVIFNGGGARTSIVGHSITLYVEDKVRTYVSDDNLIYYEVGGVPGIEILGGALLWNPVAQNNGNDYEYMFPSNQISLPLSLEGNTSIDLFLRISLKVNNSVTVLVGDPPKTLPGLPEVIPVNPIPVELVYGFQLPSGEQILTPRVRCVLLD